MYISTAFKTAYTFEEVVDLVNDGVTEGFEGIEFTSEQLAGQYAYESCEESDYAVTEHEVEGHLDILAEGGANFDYCAAVEHALALHSAAESEEEEE